MLKVKNVKVNETYWMNNCRYTVTHFIGKYVRLQGPIGTLMIRIRCFAEMACIDYEENVVRAVWPIKINAGE